MHSIWTGHHLTDVIEEWRVGIMSGVLVLLCAAANSAYRPVATSYPVFNCLENRCADWYRVAVEHRSQFCRCVSLAGVITVRAESPHDLMRREGGSKWLDCSR
jgi:hypothetical protein